MLFDEDRLLESLRKLKNEFGALELRAEFAEEAMRNDDMILFQQLALRADLPIVMKVGGVEAVRDVYHSLLFGAKRIVAPMIETPYALEKFINLIDELKEQGVEQVEYAFNVETLETLKNLDAMFNHVSLNNRIKGITIGRVDFVHSMGLKRENIEDMEVFEHCKSVLKKAKQQNLEALIGGGVSPNSRDNLTQLSQQGLLDGFETRKVVFGSHSFECIDAAIKEALKFELLWLKNRVEYYRQLSHQDLLRIKMLEKRV